MAVPFFELPVFILDSIKLFERTIKIIHCAVENKDDKILYIIV